jgi:hypothetical protein
MSIEVKAWKCDECGSAFLNKHLADTCCDNKIKEHKCRACGCAVERYYRICPSCRTKEQYEKANKISSKEYKVGCLYDPVKDKFYHDADYLFDDYNDEGEETPKWVFGCIEIPFTINIDSALERAEEEMHDEFDRGIELVDLKRLYDFIEEWNKKQDAVSYDIDYKTVVLLEE